MPSLLDLVLRAIADSPSSDTLKVAIVAALATVLAATLPALLPFARREPVEQKRIRIAQERLHHRMEHDRDRAVEDVLALRAELRTAQTRIDLLEALCWQNGINPYPPVDLRRHDDGE